MKHYCKITLLFTLITLNVVGQLPTPILSSGEVGNSPYFSQDGRMIVTTVESDKVKIWDSRSGKLLFQNISFLGKEGVLSSKISPDGAKIALKKNNIVKLFNLRNGGKLINILDVHTKDILHFEFSSNSRNFLSTSDDSTIVIWNCETGKEIFKVKTNEVQETAKDANGDEMRLDRLWKAHLNNDGETFTTWNFPIIETWNFLTKTKLYSIALSQIYCEENPILNPDRLHWTDPDLDYSMKFSDDGKYFSYKNEIYETKKGIKISLPTTLEGCYQILNFKSSIGIIDFYKPILKIEKINTGYSSYNQTSVVGDSIYSCSIQKSKIINSSFFKDERDEEFAYNGKLVKSYMSKSNKDSIFSPNKKIFLTIKDGIKAWDFKSKLLLYTFESFAYEISNINVNPNGKYVLFQRMEDNHFISSILNLEKGEISREKIKTSDGGFSFSSFNKTGEKQISVTWHDTPIEYNENDDVIIKYSKNLDEKYSVDHNTVTHLSNDEKLFLVGSSSGKLYEEISKIEVWDTESRKLYMPALDYNTRIADAEFSPDGTKIAAYYYKVDGTGKTRRSCAVVLWDVATKSIVKNLMVIDGVSCPSQNVHFSPNGKFVAANVCDTIKVWQSDNGKLITTIKSSATNFQFSNDSNYILSFSRFNGANQTIIAIWQVSNGQLINKLIGETGSSITSKISFGDVLLEENDQNIFTNLNLNVAQIWNWKNNTKIDLVGHDNTISSIKYNSNQKRIYTFSIDGHNKIWDSKDGHLICTFYILGKSDYFFQLSSGYYKCSPNALRLLHYRTNENKIVAFEQLDAKFNRPDLVLQALGSKNQILIKTFHSAYLKRIKKLGLKSEFISDEKNVSNYSIPEIDIQNEEEIDYTQNKSIVLLKVNGKSKSSIEKINIWVNEVPIHGKKGIVLKDITKLNIDTLLNIPLQLGLNSIEISITDINGTESFREKKTVYFTPEIIPNQKLYFIGIGVDKFLDINYNLNFCTKDIKDLANSFKIKYANQIVIDTIFNENVTIQNIRNLKKKLNTTEINDKVIVSYSGHGILDRDLDYYLSTYDLDFENPKSKGINYEDFEDLFDGIPARRKLLLIDACHSGEIDKDDFENKQNNTDLIKGMKPKIPSTTNNNNDESKVGLKKSYEIVKNIFTDISKGTGTKIISAAAGNQYALEKNDLKNGVFTYSILEAVKTYDHLKINDLKEIVGKRVVELTNGLQTPTSRKDVIYYDWELYNHDQEIKSVIYILLQTLAANTKISPDSGAVNSVNFSPDGSKIVSGSQDKSVKIWNTTTGTLLLTLTGHTDAVRSVNFSPDGTKIVSCSWDNSIKIWNSTTGTLLKTLSGTSAVCSVNFSPDGSKIVSGNGDASIKIWDANTGVLLQILRGHYRMVTSVNFSIDGSKIVSGSLDNRVIIWNASTGTMLRVLAGHKEYVMSVNFSPDGNKIVSGSYDKSVKVWSVSTGALIETLTGHSDAVYSVNFSPDGNRIVSGGWDKDIKIWSTQTGILIQTFAITDFNGRIESVNFSPDGSKIVSGQGNASIKIIGN